MKEIKIKICRKCKAEFSDDECIACRKARSAAWRTANPGRNKAISAAWRIANPEKSRASTAAYRAANPDKAKACTNAWRDANPDKISAYTKEWRAANPGSVRIYNQNRRARRMASGGELSKGLSEKLFKLQKGKCACCKKPLGDNYHLDHVTPLALGGLNTDDNMQLLRQRCNNQKSAKDPIDFMRSRGFLI